MRILFVKPAENTFRVEGQSSEDLQQLEAFIQPGDLVSGETDRSIKPKEVGQKAFRLKMHLTLRVQKVEFDSNGPALRVSGLIESGSPEEFVEMHAQHSLVFVPFNPITVKKQKWYGNEIDRLREYEKASHKPLYFAVVLDDEEALFIQISGAGMKEMGKVNAFKSGKQFKSDDKETVYFSKLAEVVLASPLNTIIIAGPGFTRDTFVNYLKERNPKSSPKQFLSVPTSEVGVKGLREALAHDAIAKALGDSQLAKESEIMNEVLKHLGKDDGLATYGFSQVQRSVSAGAAHIAAVSTDYLSENREKASELLELCKQMGISSFVLDSQQEPGKQLDGLGGIVSLLRYRFE